MAPMPDLDGELPSGRFRNTDSHPQRDTTEGGRDSLLAMRSIVRRDTGEIYQAFPTRLGAEFGDLHHGLLRVVGAGRENN